LLVLHDALDNYAKFGRAARFAQDRMMWNMYGSKGLMYRSQKQFPYNPRFHIIQGFA